MTDAGIGIAQVRSDAWEVRINQLFPIGEHTVVPIHGLGLELSPEETGTFQNLNDAALESREQGWQWEAFVLNALGLEDGSATYMVISNGRDNRYYQTLAAWRSATTGLVGPIASIEGPELEISGFLVAALVEALQDFPLPLFGSRPEVMSRASGIFAVPGVSAIAWGTTVATHDPVVGIVTTSGAFLMWLGRPIARLARRAIAQKVADALKMELTEDDLR
jgi:hypothetical protein